MKTKEVFDASVYPEHGEHVIYYFEPFNRWYVGKFEMDSEDNVFGPMVSGKSGFTTWHPEVTLWMKGDGE